MGQLPKIQKAVTYLKDGSRLCPCPLALSFKGLMVAEKKKIYIYIYIYIWVRYILTIYFKKIFIEN